MHQKRHFAHIIPTPINKVNHCIYVIIFYINFPFFVLYYEIFVSSYLSYSTCMHETILPFFSIIWLFIIVLCYIYFSNTLVDYYANLLYKGIFFIFPLYFLICLCHAATTIGLGIRHMPTLARQKKVQKKTAS